MDILPVGQLDINIPRIRGPRMKLVSQKKLESKVMDLYENRSPEQQRLIDGDF